MISGADHFFREKIDALSVEVNDYLRRNFNHQTSDIGAKEDVKNEFTTRASPAKKMFLD